MSTQSDGSGGTSRSRSLSIVTIESDVGWPASLTLIRCSSLETATDSAAASGSLTATGCHPGVRKSGAVPTGFEPAISSLTGTYARPLHHGTVRKYGQNRPHSPVHRPFCHQPLPRMRLDIKRRRVRFLSLAAPAGVANVHAGRVAYVARTASLRMDRVTSAVTRLVRARPGIGKWPGGRRLARARAIEGIVTEFRADRVERGVQARDPGAGEEVELLAAADPADRDADEAHRADPSGIAVRGQRVPEQRAGGLEDPQAIAHRLGQGPLARARLEGRDAQLQGHRAAAELMLAESRADVLSEPEQGVLDLRPVQRVAIEGVGVTDRLRVAWLGHDLAIVVDALRALGDGRPVLAQARLEERRIGPREVADGAHPEVLEQLLGLRTHAPEPLQRERREERGLAAARHHDEAIGLAQIRGDLRAELVRGDADGQHEADPLEDRPLETARALLDPAEEMRGAGDVEECLVERDRLAERRALRAERHTRARPDLLGLVAPPPQEPLPPTLAPPPPPQP